MAALPMALPALLMTAAGPARAAVSALDDRGATLTLAQAPKRIVSLLPSLTETVCALGACDRLVGVDRYSNHPPSVRELPILGGGIDPDIEGVVAQKPDLVLVATSSRAAERLQALGLAVFAVEPRGSEEFRRMLFSLDALLDTHAAERVWRETDAGVTAALRSIPAGASGVRVYFEVSPGPYAAGPASFTGEIMARLGARNIVPAPLGPYPKLNPEFVVRADPEVILIGSAGAASVSDRPGWSAIRAVRDGRICVFDPPDADILVRAGPRMVLAAQLIAQCLARMAP